MKRFNITVNGVAYDVAVDEIGGAAAPTVVAAPTTAPAPAPAPAPAAPVAAAPASGTKISSPMPGNILDVNVKVGDKVTNGQKLCVLEAMKMENDIKSSCDGTVASVHVAKGDVVETGTLLVVIG